MWPVPEQYARAVASPHQVRVVASVRRAGRLLCSALPVTGGSIDVDSTSATRRRLTMTVAPRLSTGTYTDISSMPDGASAPEHPLGWFGQEITVLHGLVHPSGTVQWVPAGVFRVESASGSLLDTSEVQVEGVSREAWVADDVFTSPRTVSGPSVTALIGDLIVESYEQAQIVVRTRRDRRVLPTTEESDRWGLITRLASSTGLVVYTDAAGRFVITDAPTLDTPPVWRFRPGPGGTVLDVTTSGSRQDVVNRVAYSGTTPEGAPSPIVGVATDTTSPTRYGDPSTGAFGRKPLALSDSSLMSLGAARAAAAAELARRTGLNAALDLSTVPLAPLEAGDVVDIITDPTWPAGSVRRHIVDAFTLPLTPGGAFPVRTRDIGAAS